MATSFSGGRSQSTRREPPTMSKQLINFMVKELRRVIKNGQSKETGNIGYKRRRKTKQKHNTISVGHDYVQTNTNNVNKT
jgi:hypothetical protein